MTDTRDVQRTVEPAAPVEPVVDPPWEPPIAGTELEHLSAALDRLRTTFRWKAGSLDADGLRAQVGASSLTLGALLKHLAFVEDYYFSTKLRGESPGPPWETVDWDAHPDWPFTSAGEDTPEELYALWDGAVERSRTRFAAALDEGGSRPAGRGDMAGRLTGQPAPSRLRPGRGVRATHRTRGPHP
jgi:Protein of unknown function (DUF664)